jgi:hypothetical protein
MEDVVTGVLPSQRREKRLTDIKAVLRALATGDRMEIVK